MNKQPDDILVMIITYLPGEEIFTFQNISRKYRNLIHNKNYITNYAYKTIINRSYNWDIHLILGIPYTDDRWKSIFFKYKENGLHVSKLLLDAHIRYIEENIDKHFTTMTLFSQMYTLIFDISCNGNNGDAFCFEYFKKCINNYINTQQPYQKKLKYITFLSRTFMYLDRFFLQWKMRNHQYENLFEYSNKLLIEYEKKI